MKTIKKLREEAEVLGVRVYTQGGQWIKVTVGREANHETPMHWLICTELQALEEAIRSAEENKKMHALAKEGGE